MGGSKGGKVFLPPFERYAVMPPSTLTMAPVM